MNRDCNLLESPWLPVRMINGQIVELGLLDVFEQSAFISGLAETAPPNLVAQYRLLLAIMHRALTCAFGTWTTADRARWYKQGLPLNAIREYLKHWHERFWLFHPDHPFMQVAALAVAEETRDKRKPWTQVSLASANGNTPLVFDHSCDFSPKEVCPAEAFRALLGFLQFTPGGLVKALRDSDKAGALSNTAAVIPTGETLLQTLALCLHPAPLANATVDLPPWEQEPLGIQQLRGEPVLATGPNDRYTRLSRAVLLLRENNGNVRWLHFAAGLALAEDPNAPDTMACYRSGSNGLVRYSFSEGRALWRDLPVLVPNPTGESQPPALLNYATSLHEHDSFDLVFQPVLVAGLASDQAKLLRWRCEQIVLPGPLLTDANKALFLRQLTQEAEETYRSLSNVSSLMISATLPNPNSKDAFKRARELFDAGAFSSTYFADAERAFAAILRSISSASPDTLQRDWRQALRASAEKTWKLVLVYLGNSAKGLAADARYWPRLQGLLTQQLPLNDLPIIKEA